MNFWSGSFWVPSAQPGCQKAQLSNPAGVVWGCSTDKYEQNVGIASPSSVIALSSLSGGFQQARKNLRNQSKYSREWWISTFPLISLTICMKMLLLEGNNQINPGLCWGWLNKVPGSAMGRCVKQQITLDWPDLSWCSESESCHGCSSVYSVWNRILETIWVWSAQKIRLYLPVEGDAVREINGFDYFSALSSTILYDALFMASVYGTADICHCWFHYMQMFQPLL